MEQIVFSTLLSVAKTLSRIDPPALELRVGCKVSVTMRCTARRDGRMLTVWTEMLLIVPRRVGAPRKPPIASRDGQLASVCTPHLLLSLCTSPAKLTIRINILAGPRNLRRFRPHRRTRFVMGFSLLYYINVCKLLHVFNIEIFIRLQSY